MLTPDKIAKSGSESAHQKAFFAFCAYAACHGLVEAKKWAEIETEHKGRLPLIAHTAIPALEWIFHVPNGGSRGDDKRGRSIRGGNLKAEGVKDGVWDICWPYAALKPSEPTSYYSGLWIEMKKPTQKPKRSTSKGGVSDEQISFGNFVYRQGFKVAVCYSWQEAVEVLEKYYLGY